MYKFKTCTRPIFWTHNSEDKPSPEYFKENYEPYFKEINKCPVNFTSRFTITTVLPKNNSGAQSILKIEDHEFVPFKSYYYLLNRTSKEANGMYEYEGTLDVWLTYGFDLIDQLKNLNYPIYIKRFLHNNIMKEWMNARMYEKPDEFFNYENEGYVVASDNYPYIGVGNTLTVINKLAVRVDPQDNKTKQWGIYDGPILTSTASRTTLTHNVEWVKFDNSTPTNFKVVVFESDTASLGNAMTAREYSIPPKYYCFIVPTVGNPNIQVCTVSGVTNYRSDSFDNFMRRMTTSGYWANKLKGVYDIPFWRLAKWQTYSGDNSTTLDDGLYLIRMYYNGIDSTETPLYNLPLLIMSPEGYAKLEGEEGFARGWLPRTFTNRYTSLDIQGDPVGVEEDSDFTYINQLSENLTTGITDVYTSWAQSRNIYSSGLVIPQYSDIDATTFVKPHNYLISRISYDGVYLSPEFRVVYKGGTYGVATTNGGIGWKGYMTFDGTKFNVYTPLFNSVNKVCTTRGTMNTTSSGYYSWLQTAKTQMNTQLQIAKERSTQALISAGGEFINNAGSALGRFVSGDVVGTISKSVGSIFSGVGSFMKAENIYRHQNMEINARMLDMRNSSQAKNIMSNYELDDIEQKIALDANNKIVQRINFDTINKKKITRYRNYRTVKENGVNNKMTVRAPLSQTAINFYNSLLWKVGVKGDFYVNSQIVFNKDINLFRNPAFVLHDIANPSTNSTLSNSFVYLNLELDKLLIRQLFPNVTLEEIGAIFNIFDSGVRIWYNTPSKNANNPFLLVPYSNQFSKSTEVMPPSFSKASTKTRKKKK